MLQCNSVGVTLGGKEILSNVSFTLRQSAFTAVLGKNGSGKSTLAACICAQQKHTGQITLCGSDLASLPPRARAQRIAVLPQNVPTPNITVRELVSLGRNPYIGLSRRMGDEDFAAIDRALTRTDLGAFADRMLPTLSGGERQRAYLAMILAQDADVLLLDEPTTYMDIRAEAEFLQLLRALTAEGKTLLVILHDLTLAAKYADDVLILEHGRQTFCGTKEECLKKCAIESTFSVRRINVDGEVLFLA
ncbi:MAG: ABC transporter ATP-binding protein [Clostridia bacterium]|nr:ABC transporter ATP-binding protein [Clostridia bacterium]